VHPREGSLLVWRLVIPAASSGDRGSSPGLSRILRAMSSATILRTPLYGAHVNAGGKMVPFAGYEMPVQYQSVISECKAVRDHAGMFDVSHMARLTLIGAKVIPYLEWVTANDISKLSDGVGQYSLLPNEKGGCVDDIIVYRVLQDRFSMVVNASNHEKDVAWLKKQNNVGVEISDQTDQTAMIAVQGPAAVALLAQHSNAEESLLNAPAFGVVRCHVEDIDCVACRSGYTGEDGYELVCSSENADALWDALVEMGVKPCGLASRDALRVEAGLPLYGHELGDDINPISAGLGWVVGKTKEFIGSAPINKARTEGTSQKLLGVRLDSKRLLAPEMKVYVDGAVVGAITSGVYSTILEASIGFAFIDSKVALDIPCEVDIRGKRESGRIVSKRFFKRAK
jgi:aminomethyltransferase